MSTCLVPCFVCGVEFDAVDKLQPYGGVVCYTAGNYGSRVLDCIAGDPDELVFLICDNCLVESKDRVIGRKSSTKTTLEFVYWNPPSLTEEK